MARVAAIFSAGSRPFIISGVHLAMVARSSVYSISLKAWCWRSSSWRFLRNAVSFSPRTKERCGTGLMKFLGEPKALLPLM
ncbi:hypothetical protein D9M68_357040 [compost metagenome]